MKKIITIIKPFDFQQFVGVYEDGEQVCMYNVPMDRLQDRIPEFAEFYDVEEIDIAGPKAFTSKVKEDVEQYNITKYSERKLTINLI